MKAWWFDNHDGRLGYDDGRIIRAGRTLKVKGTIELCERGLHGSERLLDALKYARSPTLWRVDLGGDILHGDDKVCAAERTHLWRLDIDDILRDFARRCALDAIHLWDAPEIVVRYLKTGDESLRAASRDAAGDAARAASRDAAGAARAAENAAWDAASAAASDKQNRRLTAMVMAARSKS